MAQKAVLDNKSLENIDLSKYLQTSGGTITGNLSVTGTIDGTASSAIKIKRYWQRGNDCNIELADINNISFMTMADGNTLNKPGDDGYLLTNSWDWGGYGSQLYMSHDGHIYSRASGNASGNISSWQAWNTLWDSGGAGIKKLYTGNLSTIYKVGDTISFSNANNYNYFIINYTTDGDYSTAIVPYNEIRYLWGMWWSGKRAVFLERTHIKVTSSGIYISNIDTYGISADGTGATQQSSGYAAHFRIGDVIGIKIS